ncbi:MAG: regulatory protein RecX, partial [Pseudomonadota bacterium]
MRPRATPDPKDPLAARRKAMDLLARREYGFAELVDRIVKNGFDRDVVELVVEALADEGLQSDQRMAESLIAARARQGKGPERVTYELRERGVATNIADLALADADIDWIEIARVAREQRFGDEQPADFPDFARQANFLKRRGF